jgi:ribosomal protein S18 acetylase RimI-like enzyme
VSAAWGLEQGALWALDLRADGLPRDDASGNGLDVRFAPVSPAAAAALAAAMDLPEAEVVARMARGSQALALWRGEEVASYCWVSARREHVGELARDLTLPAGESYIWDCATVSRFRGRGLYTRLLRAIAAALAEEGQSRAWIGASSTNQASNRTFATVGFRPAVAVVSLRLGGRGLIVRVAGARDADPALVDAARHLLTRRS